MRKFAPTWILTVVVALVAGYTFYEYKHAEGDLEEALGERPAFTLKRENIDDLTFKSKDETIVLHKDGDDWKMKLPVQDLADESAIEGFLFSLTTQKLKTFLPDDEAKAVKWSDYGLEPPGTTVELGAKGAREELQVGTKNAFDGSYYVRQKDEVLLGDRGLARLVERTASSFRSRHLWREDDGVELESVTVSADSGKEKFSFTKTPAAGDKDAAAKSPVWTMTPKPDYGVDSGKVAAWIEKVEDLLPNDFIKEGITSADKKNDLLVKPSYVVAIDFKKKDGKAGHWELTLGQDKAGDVYLYTDQRPTIYKTSTTSLDAIRVPKAYFRDSHEPFAFPIEPAREIRVRTDKTNHSFKKTDSGWALAGEDGKSQLNQEKLVQLLQNIRNLEAVEFGPVGSKGFKTQPQVEVRGDNDKVLFRLAWGDGYKSKTPWNKGANLRFVKTNLNPGVMGAAAEKLEALEKLVNESLVAPKGETKKAAAGKPEKK